MKFRLVCMLLLLPFFLKGQTVDQTEIRKTIDRLFEGMRKSDSSLVRSAFAPGAILQTVKDDVKGATVSGDRLSDFLKAVAREKTAIWDERMVKAEIHIDDNLASVWAPYIFYLGKTAHHGGIDSFQLVKGKDGWRIVHLIDTQKTCN